MADEPELSPGDSGEWVTYLQQRLQGAGFLTGQVTGDYDADTEQSVRSLQEANGAQASGTADAATWSLLDAYGEASSGEAGTDPGATGTDPGATGADPGATGAAGAEVTADDLAVFNDTGAEAGDESQLTETTQPYFASIHTGEDLSQAELAEVLDDSQFTGAEGQA